MNVFGVFGLAGRVDMKEKRERKPSRKCTTEGCGRDHHAQGLCKLCWYGARRLVQSGETTEAELVEMGLMLPVDETRVPPSLFRARFLAASAAEPKVMKAS